MSDHDRSDLTAFRQLELMVRSLGDELANFRRRAQVAEARVRSLEGAVAHGADDVTMERLRSLEAENEQLKARVAFATTRTRQLLSRLRFLRQQEARPVSAPSNGRESA